MAHTHTQIHTQSYKTCTVRCLMQMREHVVTCAFQNEQALKQHKTNLIHTQQRKSAQIHKRNASP